MEWRIQIDSNGDFALEGAWLHPLRGRLAVVGFSNGTAEWELQFDRGSETIMRSSLPIAHRTILAQLATAPAGPSSPLPIANPTDIEPPPEDPKPPLTWRQKPPLF